MVQGYYPTAVSFYASGHLLDTKLHNLPLARLSSAGLQLADRAPEAEAQIGQFLRTTRQQHARAVRRALQANPETALRNRGGQVLRRFGYEHWEKLTWRIGYTTVFDLLGRLQISGDQREIRRFTDADIDFALFHASLLNLVSYLNFVHEAYVARAVGTECYQRWLVALPDHLAFVRQRSHLPTSATVGQCTSRSA